MWYSMLNILLTHCKCKSNSNCREDVPESMTELTIKYNLDADGLLLKDLFPERDFLAEHLGLPRHLLQVISWGNGSIVITYWMVRDVLPLAELALCREDVRAALTQHGVEDVYLGTHPSKHSDLVRSGNGSLHCSVLFYGTSSSFNAGGPITADCTL